MSTDEVAPVGPAPTGARSGFFRQLTATMRRQLTQKIRNPCGFVMEIIIPIIFVVGLVAASQAEDIKINPAENYYSANQTVLEFTTAVNDGQNLCYVGVTDPRVMAVLPACSFADPNLSPEFSCYPATSPSGFSMPIDNICSRKAFAGDILGNMTNFEFPIQGFAFDDMVKLQWAYRAVFGAPTDDPFGEGVPYSLRNSGKLYFVDNVYNRQLVAYMNSTYSLFDVLFGEYFSSRGEGARVLSEDLQREGKTWALIDITSMNANSFEFELSMNRTGIQWTQRVRERFLGGLGEKGYAKYAASGFVTLQTTLYNFYARTMKNVTIPAESVPVGVPMPIDEFKNSVFLSIAGILAPLVLCLSFLYPVSQMAKLLVQDKETRVREGSLVMGLSKSAYFISWMLFYIIQMFVTCFLTTLVLSVGITTESDPTIIFLLYFLFGITTVGFGFLLSSVLSKSKTTALVSPLIFFVCSIPGFSLPETTSAGTYYFLSLLSPTAFGVGVRLLFQYEIGDGIGWGDVSSNLDTVPMSGVFGMLTLDIFLYFGLAFYLDAVVPSEWGTSLHPLFCFFGKTAKTSKKAKKDDENGPLELATMTGSLNDRPRHIDGAVASMKFESYPGSAEEATMTISGLVKEFETESGVKRAVNQMDLKVFPNQITVLLGHNGAGKTTTVNMALGMLDTTEGDVEIYGNSVNTNLAGVRQEVGYCPQHNILWPELTCMEHLRYFARLKGVAEEDLDDECKEMLAEVELSNKADVRSSALSGGQKRKLSVAMSFIGGSRLIILDEPTAGMDVSARRATWDLLRKKSSGRTILLTTHYMDEADLLSNRIAIMSRGSLHSYGSSLYLKNRFGTGYAMKISCSSAIGNPEPLLAAVQNIIPDAAVKECKGMELAIALPMAQKSKFVEAIRAASSQPTVVGVSMSVSTLEDVFLQIAAEEESGVAPRVPESDEITRPGSVSPGAQGADAEVTAALNTAYGAKASVDNAGVVPQLVALFKKRLANARRDRRTIVLQIVFPILCLILAMILAELGPPELGPLRLDIAMYDGENSNGRGGSPGPQALTAGNCNNLFSYFDPRYVKENLGNTTAPAVSQYLLNTIQKQGNKERFVSFRCDGRDLDNSRPVVFANSTAVHSYPHGVQEWWNAALRAQTGEPGINMVATNYPLPWTSRQKVTIDAISAVLVAIFVLIPFTFIPSIYVAWIVKERETQAKHQQFVSGVNFVAYWLSNFFFDLISFLFTTALAFLIFAIFSRDEYIGDSESGGVVFMLFLFYGLSIIMAVYGVSFLFDNHSSAQTTVLLGNFICGFALVITQFVLVTIPSTESAGNALKWIFRIIPSYCLGEGLILVASAPSARAVGEDVDLFAMDQVGPHFIYMTLETLVFGAITIFLDHPSRRLRQQQLGFSSTDPAPVPEGEDEDVAAERLDSAERLSKDAVTVRGLRKIYPKTAGSPEKMAVDSVSFGVKKGEVFGFLGTNGAGKTTTMSILTGQQLPSMGSAYVDGFDVVADAGEAHRRMGYCPQFDAIFELLTPLEHLNLYAAIRGVDLTKRVEAIDALLLACGLQEFRDLPAERLSGGNKRKLSVAIALIGAPSIVMLDEPSAGMDPQARRQLWDVITYASTLSSIVLTTHHLEEVDVLAHRVAIMVDGRVECIGSLEHLKRKFGAGCELTVKTPADPTAVEAVTRFVTGRFPGAKIIESRPQRVIFEFTAETRVDELFDVMEKVKEGFEGPQIEDYLVQQTSLEQVFLRISQGAEAQQRSSPGEEETTSSNEDKDSNDGVLHVPSNQPERTTNPIPPN